MERLYSDLPHRLDGVDMDNVPMPCCSTDEATSPAGLDVFVAWE